MYGYIYTQMAFYEIDGMRPVLMAGAFVHPSADVIGDVLIGRGVYVGPQVALRGDLGRIVIEADANVQDNCVLHGWPNCDTVIEAEGHLGHAAIVHGARVGRGALIGMGAVVLENARIGEFAVVAANSVVLANMDVPARALVAGSPAKIKRELSDADVALKQQGTDAYKELVVRCLKSLKAVEPLAEIEDNRKRVQDIHPHLNDLNPRN